MCNAPYLRFGMVLAFVLTGTVMGGDTRLPPRVSSDSPPPLTIEQLARRSGSIFLGRVEKIEVPKNESGQMGEYVRITFRVLDGIRGARTGESVAVHEWKGLWAGGANQRYRRGEMWMMFFHPPSKLGLTSPVGGPAGKIEVTTNYFVELSPDRIQTLFPRAMRLRSQQASLIAIQGPGSSIGYAEFAQVVREVASVGQK